MPIDVAGDLASIFGGGDFTPLAGTLSRGSSSSLFTSATVSASVVRPGANKRLDETATITILASELSFAPEIDDKVVYSSEDGSQPWVVVEVTPIQSPAASAAGYTVKLRRHINKSS